MLCRFRAFQKTLDKRLLTERCITVRCGKRLFPLSVLFMKFCIILKYVCETSTLKLLTTKSPVFLGNQ